MKKIYVKEVTKANIIVSQLCKLKQVKLAEYISDISIGHHLRLEYINGNVAAFRSLQEIEFIYNFLSNES